MSSQHGRPKRAEASTRSIVVDGAGDGVGRGDEEVTTAPVRVLRGGAVTGVEAEEGEAEEGEAEEGKEEDASVCAHGEEVVPREEG